MGSKSCCSLFEDISLKARQVADLVRGKDAKEAIGILRYTNKRSAPLINKSFKISDSKR